jgi:hypothetical protein
VTENIHKNKAKYINARYFLLKLIMFSIHEQMPHALNGSFCDVTQMAYPSLGSQDLSMRPSQDGFEM